MNPLRWFSTHDSAKLSCSVNVVKISSRRARYLAAPSTIRGDDSHLRLFQTNLIGLRCGKPTGRKVRSIPSPWARSRVCAQVCEEAVQDEQNPDKRILLADLLETRADLFFLLIRRKLEDTLTVECTEPGRWCVDFHQWPGDCRFVCFVESLGIIPWSRVRDIKESDRCPAIRPNIIVKRPVFVIVPRLFVMCLVSFIIVEHIRNAFVEDFRSVVRPVRPLRTRNRVREAPIVQQSW